MGSPWAVRGTRVVLTAPVVHLVARVDSGRAIATHRAMSARQAVTEPSSSTGPTLAPATAPRAVALLVPKAAPSARSETVIGLGDSVTAGSKCSCDNFVTLLAQSDADDAQWTARNAAQDGLTSGGLLGLLDDDDVIGWTQHSDAAVVTIGANDFDSTPVRASDCSPENGVRCYRDGLRALRGNLTQIVARLSQRERGARRVLVTGYWNVFLDGEVGRAQGQTYVRNSDALTRQVNATIKDVAEANGARYVDLYAAFKADGDDTALLERDGDHPNAAGHRLIAQVLSRELAAARSGSSAIDQSSLHVLRELR